MGTAIQVDKTLYMQETMMDVRLTKSHRDRDIGIDMS